MVDLSWSIVWKSAFIVLYGIILLRISGRKSIAQMTAATSVIMISIGALLAQGIIDQSVWKSAAAVGLFILILVITEYLELKSGMLARWLSGKAHTVIREGRVDETQLRKMRMSYDQLEMRLRQKGISRISDIKNLTIEINGEIGYELKDHAKPVTVGELEKMMEKWMQLSAESSSRLPESPNLFEEVIQSEAASKSTH